MKAKNMVLRKSIGAIHSKSDKPLTLLQRKLFNVLYYHAQEELLTKCEHRIKINQLDQYLGYRGNNWSNYNEAIRVLQTTFATWNIFGQCCVESENITWERVQYLGRSGWDSNKKEFFYTFDQELSKKLYRPDRYAKILLEQQNQFRSSNALVLYEQCTRYLTNKQGSRWFTIKELKDLFSMGETTYPLYKIFNANVIKPSITEINKVSDIQVVLEQKRQGKSIIALKFYMSSKQNPCLNENISNLDQDKENTQFTKKGDITDRMVLEFGIREEIANRLLLKFGENQINNAMKYVKNMQAQQRIKQSVAGYLVKAIENNYQDQEEFTTEKLKREKMQQIVDIKMKESATHLQNSYEAYRNETIDNTIKTLTLLEREKFLNHFRIFAKDQLNYLFKGKVVVDDEIIASRMLRFSLRNFAFNYLSSLKENIATLKAFIGKQKEEEVKAWNILYTHDHVFRNFVEMESDEFLFPKVGAEAKMIRRFFNE